MALDKTVLKDGLLGLFGAGTSPAFPTDLPDAAQKWADLISTYASDGTLLVVGTDVEVGTLAIDALKGALILGFVQPGTPDTAADAIANGLVSFWGLVTCTTATGGGLMLPTALKGALVTIFSPPFTGKDADTQAGLIADAIDTASHTVVYTITAPPPATDTVD